MPIIHTRDVDEQTVLTEQREVTAHEVSAFIQEAGGRQHQALTVVGGPFGPTLVIYHGPVTEDTASTVEVCSPLPADIATTVPLRSRIEPAHAEAYTRITKGQVRFPEILESYDAVKDWISDNGRTVLGAPREVYFTDMMDVTDTTEVADIAYPIARSD